MRSRQHFAGRRPRRRQRGLDAWTQRRIGWKSRVDRAFKRHRFSWRARHGIAACQQQRTPQRAGPADQPPFGAAKHLPVRDSALISQFPQGNVASERCTQIKRSSEQGGRAEQNRFARITRRDTTRNSRHRPTGERNQAATDCTNSANCDHGEQGAQSATLQKPDKARWTLASRWLASPALPSSGKALKPASRNRLTKLNGP